MAHLKKKQSISEGSPSVQITPQVERKYEALTHNMGHTGPKLLVLIATWVGLTEPYYSPNLQQLNYLGNQL